MNFYCIERNRFGSIFNGNISCWNTSGVRDMSYMLYGAVAFDQNIQHWDTSKVLDMSYMFSPDWNVESSFNHPNSDWNTSQVTNMINMFSSATSFNQPIGPTTRRFWPGLSKNHQIFLKQWECCSIPENFTVTFIKLVPTRSH